MHTKTSRVQLCILLLIGLFVGACKESQDKVNADDHMRAVLGMRKDVGVDPAHIKAYLDQSFPQGTPMTEVYAFLQQRGISYSDKTYPGAATCVLSYRSDESRQRAIMIVLHVDSNSRVKSIEVSYHGPDM